MSHTIRQAASAAILATLVSPIVACAQDAQQAPATAVVKAGPSGISIGSSDDANVLRLRGTLHFDARRFADDVTPDTEDTFLLRRVRPTLEGTLNSIYDFRVMPDFGGGRTVIVDAFVAARFRPWLRFTAGKFKVPVGLERLQSSNDLRFIERGLPTSLVPNRDLGLSIDGEVVAGKLSYSVGYFNGVTDGGSSDGNAESDVDDDGSGDWAARVFVQPYSGLGVGIAATYGESTGSPTRTQLPSYRTPGQQTFFSYRAADTFADGERLRIAPQFYYYVGRFGVLGEYTQVTQQVSRNTPAVGLRSDKLAQRAWQLQLSWFVTGEKESFRGFELPTTFSIDQGTWGAFELAVRVHQLDIDDDAFAGGIDSFADPTAVASRARAYGLGVSWYLNQNFKWQLNYDVTEFDGGAPTGDRDDERALFARFALGF